MTGRTLIAAMIVFALIVVPMAAYVGGYYGLPLDTDVSYSANQTGVRYVARFYRHRWQAQLFSPAAKTEEWLTSDGVDVYCLDDLVPDSAGP